MIYFVYVIKSKSTNRFYTGMSCNPQKRLKDHNAGRVLSTKGYRPWNIVYTEKIGSRSEARNREKFLKSGAGREFAQKKINMPG